MEDNIDPYRLGVYITLIIAFCLMIVGLILSNVSFALVVKT